MEIDILITSRDRHTEITLLLQALRTQTFQNWNLFILDDASGTPLLNNHAVACLINRIRMEGHAVNVIRNPISYGACYARNLLNKTQLELGTGDYSMRLDDDIIPEKDYIEKLISVINEGYDIASGVIPPIGHPLFQRESKFLNGGINKVVINTEGDLVQFDDDCGYCYLEDAILPAGHFRSCALYKSEINNIKYPDNLSQYGFREESFFSLKCRMKGYKIGVHTGARVLHLQTPSGGGRQVDPAKFGDMCRQDDITFRKWVKKKVLSGELKI